MADNRDKYLPVERLEELIELIKEIGSRPSRLAGLPQDLLDHPSVARRALASDNTAKAFALIELLKEAADLMGDPTVNPRAEAARHLFGLTPDTRGRLLKDRRRIAADCMILKPRSFRLLHEDDIQSDFVVAVYITLLRESTGAA